MELREKGAVGDVGVEALRVDARGGVLDVELDHLHSLDLLAVVVEADGVLQAVRQVLLRHRADGVGPVDEVILLGLAGLLVLRDSVDGEIRPHDDAADDAAFLVRDGELLRPDDLLPVVELLPRREDSRGVHQRDTRHARPVAANQRLVHDPRPIGETPRFCRLKLRFLDADAACVVSLYYVRIDQINALV